MTTGRFVSLALIVGAIAGCSESQAAPTTLPTAAVTRGDIKVTVQATGSVGPIDTIQVKSKASGVVIKMPVDVGSEVKAGDLVVQIDPHDVLAQFQQAQADDVAAVAALVNAKYTQNRSDSLFKERVLTAAGYDSATVNYKSVAATVVNKRAALDLARQALEDATIHAPITGTVISRVVALGAVVASATGAGAGQALLTMADLTKVRMRVTVDEVEMANVHVGEAATVRVDAFPDRTFEGSVEKIEPQAVVLQGVTFFPVQVTVHNEDRALMPGMNGEVTMNAGVVKNTVQTPIDAIRTTKELGSVARLFGMDVDSLSSLLRMDLVSPTAPQHSFVVVALNDSTYELRLAQFGASNLEQVQVMSGVNEGQHVVLVGAAGLTRPAVPPKLQIAADIRKGARPVPIPRAASPTGKP